MIGLCLGALIMRVRQLRYYMNLGRLFRHCPIPESHVSHAGVLYLCLPWAVVSHLFRRGPMVYVYISSYPGIKNKLRRL